MSIEQVLAAIPVSDLDRSVTWYERFFGRSPDNRPMDNLAEWQVTDRGWVQIFSRGGRPGSGFVNFAVDDMDRHRHELHERGVETGDVQQASKDVQLCPVSDPDDNSITLIGNFRVRY